MQSSVLANCKDRTIRPIVVLANQEARNINTCSGSLFGLCLMWKGHCGRRVFFFLLSSFNCEQFHNLRPYRTSELELRTYYSNIEDNCMLGKSKSSVQDTKSIRNRTSMFTTEFNKHVHESKQCMYSFSVYPYRTESSIGQHFNHQSKSGVQIQHIELKVQSGSISEQN